MIRSDCQNYESLLKAGALLRAGLSLSNEEHSALHEHLARCAACQALAQNIQTLDNNIRTALHGRWDAVPRPRRIAAKIVQSEMRRQNMARGLKTLAGALVALALVAVIFFTFRQITPAKVDLEKISEHPEQYLLRYEDMPDNTEYYLPGASDYQTRPYPTYFSNKGLIDSFGRGETEKVLADIEQIDAWNIRYQRLNADDPGFESIQNWIAIHKTSEGAQKAVIENSRVFWDQYYMSAIPREPLGAINNLGDTAQASKAVNALSPGFEFTTYRVDFAYQTVSVRVQVTDLSSRVTLEDAVDLARIVLDHLKE